MSNSSLLRRTKLRLYYIKIHYVFASRRRQYYNFLRFIGVRYYLTKVGQYPLWVDLSDPILGTHYFLHQEYETTELAVFRKLIRPGMTVLDIGANIGYYTIHFANWVGNKGKVFAFEPEPNNLKLLKQNITNNGLTNVIAEPVAVMDKSGQIEFFLSKHNFGDHRSVSSSDTISWRKMVVNSIRLDEYFGERQIDIMKIDVQGAEMAVLLGMGKLLENPQLVILCEFWPFGLHQSGHDPLALIDLLNSYGLRIFQIDESAGQIIPFDTTLRSFPIEHSEWYTNILCLHAGHVDHLSLVDSLNDAIT